MSDSPPRKPLLSGFPVPRCLVCAKPVEAVDLSIDGISRRYNFTLRCHGMTEHFSLSHDEAEEAAVHGLHHTVPPAPLSGT